MHTNIDHNFVCMENKYAYNQSSSNISFYGEGNTNLGLDIHMCYITGVVCLPGLSLILAGLTIAYHLVTRKEINR